MKLIGAELFDREPLFELDGLSLDRLDLDCDQFEPAPELLVSATHEAPVSEVLTLSLIHI